MHQLSKSAQEMNFQKYCYIRARGRPLPSDLKVLLFNVFRYNVVDRTPKMN